MKLREAAAIALVIVSLLACGTGASAGGQDAVGARHPAAPASGETADAFLHSIYDLFIGPHSNGAPIEYTNLRDLQRYFEPSLASIIYKDAIRAKQADDMPAMDSDVFIDAQDWDIKSIDIRVTTVNANRAVGLIKFNNAGTAEVLHVQLVRIAGAWKIHDIDYGGSEGTLRGIYKAAGAANRPPRPFGTYPKSPSRRPARISRAAEPPLLSAML